MDLITGLGHRFAFWFILITAFLLSIVSLFVSSVNVGIVVPSYIGFCMGALGIITGSKSYSNKLKTKIEESKINKGNN